MVFDGQLVVLDLSAQWSSNSFSVAALSAVAAAQQVVAVESELGYLVLDEAWSLLADPHALRWLQGSWKLARAKGLSHVLVLHRWSDVAAAGDVGIGASRTGPGTAARVRDGVALSPTARRGPRDGGGAGTAPSRGALSRGAAQGRRARALRRSPFHRARAPRRARPRASSTPTAR